jgi:hypothetical protein
VILRHLVVTAHKAEAVAVVLVLLVLPLQIMDKVRQEVLV